MPLRGGESVGQAYVRIYADGSEVPGDIRRALRDSEPSVREEGKRLGGAYSKSFVTEFGKSKNEMFHDLDEGWNDALARLDLADDFFKSPAWRKFTARIEKDFPNEMRAAARLAVKRMEAEFRDSGNLEALPDRMGRIGIEVRRAQKDILDSLHADALTDHKAWMRRQAAMLQEAYDMNRVHNERTRRQQADMLAEAYRLNRLYDAREAKAHKDMLADAYNTNRIFNRRNQDAFVQFRNNMREIAGEIDKLQQGTSRFRHSQLQQMVDSLKNVAPHLSVGSHQLDLFNDRLLVMHRRLGEMNPRLDHFDRSIVRLGDHMGRLFGKGSRNDFINFFGSFVRLLTQAPRLLIAVAKPFVTLASQVKDAAATGGPLKALGVAIGGVGILAAKAAVAVLAFATFIGFIGVVAGPVVSILSGLLGILTALASTIVYASGALAAFLPLIIPVAGIIAGIVAAVMDLKGATGELGKTMDEISDKSTRLWERFKSGVGDSKGLHRVLDEVNRALSDMDPLIDATIKGFNRFADQIAQEMQGGAFDKFTDRFARFLPHAMKDLGTIIGNTFGGLAGILRASIPSANTLLDNLVDITDRFDEWANSKKGQQEIKRFLEDAVESAEALGGFIEDAWFFLKRLMIEGKESGDRIFKNMGDDLAKATKFFEDNPDALENWFEHAEETAHQIGDIIDAVIKLADTLDSESSRTEQLYLFRGLSFFIQGLATQIGLVDKAIGGIIFAISGRWVGDLFAAMGAALTSGADSDWWAAVQRWGDGVQDRLEQLGKDIWYVIGGEWVGELWNGITDAFSSLFAGGGGDTLLIRPRFDPSAILEGLRSLPGRVRGLLAPVVNAFGGLAERAARAAGDIRGRIMERFSGLASRVQGEVDRMVARFGNVAERIGRTIGSVWDAISERFTSIAGHVGQAVDAIVQQFVGLAGRILRTIGDIVIRPRVVMPNVSGGGASGKVEQLGGGDTPPGGGQPQDRGVGSRSMAADPAVSLVATGTTAVFPSAVGGKVVDASGWQIITPSENPRIVATEVVNELIARVV